MRSEVKYQKIGLHIKKKEEDRYKQKKTNDFVIEFCIRP